MIFNNIYTDVELNTKINIVKTIKKITFKRHNIIENNDLRNKNYFFSQIMTTPLGTLI